MSMKKNQMEVILGEVYKQFIAIKDDDYKRQQTIFYAVFCEVKKAMEEQCNFFKKYSKQVLYAGSVYDGIKVTELNEFDMDIVIRLPISYQDGENGIIIENNKPGYIKLLIQSEFDNLVKKPEWENCHKVINEWRDAQKYFLQNKFRQWMHSVVQKAVNKLNNKVVVDGVNYQLKYKESGPAFTLNIRNDIGNEYFLLDVDLVPVIKFSLPRWPKGYRTINKSTVTDWLVVPKPNKAIKDDKVKNRCWRLSFQEHERELMRDRQNLKLTIRLVKKLRDSSDMKEIASYYIKTLFLWKLHKEDKSYWQTGLRTLFLVMVKELCEAIKKKNIRYFWNPDLNLIEGLRPTVRDLYVEKLQEFINNLEANNMIGVIKALLTKEEHKRFRESDFYPKGTASLTQDEIATQYTMSNAACSKDNKELVSGVSDKIIENMQNQIRFLTKEITFLKKRVEMLEEEKRKYKNMYFNVEQSLATRMAPLHLNVPEKCEITAQKVNISNSVQGLFLPIRTCPLDDQLNIHGRIEK